MTACTIVSTCLSSQTHLVFLEVAHELRSPVNECGCGCKSAPQSSSSSAFCNLHSARKPSCSFPSSRSPSVFFTMQSVQGLSLVHQTAVAPAPSKTSTAPAIGQTLWASCHPHVAINFPPPISMSTRLVVLQSLFDPWKKTKRTGA